MLKYNFSIPGQPKEYFTTRLSPMASLAYQQRFGLEGTSDEYILLEEVLEGIGECIRTVISNSDACATLTLKERESIQELDPLYRALSTPLSWAEALADPKWDRLRIAATRVLGVMNFDIAAWEASENLRVRN